MAGWAGSAAFASLGALALLASPAAAGGKVLAFLNQISGMKTVGGVHNDQKVGGASYYTNRLQTATGKVPGLWGGDFSFDERMEHRWDMILEAEKQWKAGSLVNIMWHACPPTQNEPCGWDGGVKSHLSAEQWTDLVTDGGALNKVWKTRMDRIAPYLKYLEDKGVEVLWRPHHEMNQGNFWWGGRGGKGGTARLYRVTYDYLTMVKGLKNLVWTWDIQDLRFDWEEYHPGDAYFDVMALDMYSMGFTDSLYRTMLRLAGDKLIALGEVERVPSSEVLSRQPRYAFVMAWAYLTFDGNTGPQLTEMFTAPNVLTRDEMPGWDNVTVAAAPRGRSGLAAEGLNLTMGVDRITVPMSETTRVQLRLSALDGNQLRTVDAAGGRAEIPVADIKPGIYMVTAALNGKIASQRIVLNGGPRN